MNAKMVTVILRDGVWVCWGCRMPADLAPWQLEQMQRATPIGSAHIIAEVPHGPGCVLDTQPCIGPGDYG